MKKLPDFTSERVLWRKGFRFIAGTDEVGRGAWAGPIVAGAVIFAPAPQIQNSKFKVQNLDVRIDDSKRLNVAQRELAAEWIRENALAWGIGEIGPQLINRLGMARASKMVFRRAIAECNNKLQITGLSGVSSQLAGNQVAGSETEKLQTESWNLTNWKIDFLLLDAFYIPYVNGVRRKNQLAIIKGDQKSFSIAAASIIAKVYRDKLMRSLSKQAKYKKYGWGKGKGYGTRAHQKAIKKYGITRMHRKQFVETWRANRGTTQNNTRNNARGLA